MKKIIICLVVFLLINVLLPSCRTPEKDNESGITPESIITEPSRRDIDVTMEDMTAEGVKLLEGTMDIQISGSTAYCLLENRIVSIQLNEGDTPPKTTLYQTDHTLTAFALDGDRLYACDLTDHALLELSLDGELLDAYALNDTEFHTLAVRNGQAALGEEIDGFWVYDFTQNDPEKMEHITRGGLAGISRMEYVKDNVLMLCSATGMGNILYIYNLENGQVSAPLNDRGAMDYNQGTAYYATKSAVLTADGVAIRYFSRNNADSSPRKLFVEENYVLYWSWSLADSRLIIEERDDKLLENWDGETVTLYMLAPEARKTVMHSLAAVCRDEHEIMLKTMIIADEAKMNQKLLAGDEDFDLFQLFSQASLPHLVKNGGFAALNDYPRLMENFDQMIPGVKALFSHEGEVFGVPTSIFMELYQLDASAGEVLTNVPDMDWTLDEMWAACEELKGSGKSLYARSVRLNELIESVLFQTVVMEDFDTFTASADADAKENIADILEKIDKYHKAGVLIGKDGLISPAMYGYVDKLTQKSGSALIGAPRAGEESRLSVWGSAWMMNRSSPNKQAAADVLTVMTSAPFRWSMPELYASPIFPETENYSTENGVAYFPKSKNVQALLADLDKIYTDSEMNWQRGIAIRTMAEDYANGAMTHSQLAEKLYEQIRYYVCE